MIPDEFFRKIQERKPGSARPVQIVCGKSATGEDYWAIAGLGVNCGGYESFMEATQKWLESVNTLEEEVTNA